VESKKFGTKWVTYWGDHRWGLQRGGFAKWLILLGGEVWGECGVPNVPKVPSENE